MLSIKLISRGMFYNVARQLVSLHKDHQLFMHPFIYTHFSLRVGLEPIPADTGQFASVSQGWGGTRRQTPGFTIWSLQLCPWTSEFSVPGANSWLRTCKLWGLNQQPSPCKNCSRCLVHIGLKGEIDPEKKVFQSFQRSSCCHVQWDTIWEMLVPNLCCIIFTW